MACKLKDFIKSENRLVHTRNHLYLVICAAGYYLFQKDIHTCVLKILQDKEVMVLNPILNTVH